MDIASDNAGGDLARGEEAHFHIRQASNAGKVTARATQGFDAEAGSCEELLGLLLEAAFRRDGKL
jgi:hypothetical protein